MDYQQTIDFLYRHIDSMIWMLGLMAAYSLGARRALGWLKHSYLLPLALDHAYDAVEEYSKRYGKPGNKYELGLKFARDFMRRLRVAPPVELPQAAEQLFADRAASDKQDPR